MFVMLCVRQYYAKNLISLTDARMFHCNEKAEGMLMWDDKHIHSRYTEVLKKKKQIVTSNLQMDYMIFLI